MANEEAASERLAKQLAKEEAASEKLAKIKAKSRMTGTRERRRLGRIMSLVILLLS